MNLDLTTIQAQFDAVRSGDLSREQASDWARKVREADDRGELTITPEVDRKQIWESLLFLEGYDMKNAPNEYMYQEEDLIANRPPCSKRMRNVDSEE
jgi:hypothetical protein